MNDTEHNKHSA